jgi:uncharacterized membrane protein YhaH (DUF805 family)
MNVLNLLFSFKGRLNRKHYWRALFFIVAPITALAVVIRIIIPPLGGDVPESVKLLLGLIVMVPFAVAILAILVRRLHDLDYSGWWLLTAAFAIPLFSWTMSEIFSLISPTWHNSRMVEDRITDVLLVTAVALLGALPGTVGPNRFDYAPSPVSGSDNDMVSQ